MPKIGQKWVFLGKIIYYLGVKTLLWPKTHFFSLLLLLLILLIKKFYRKKVGFWPRAVFSVKGVTRKTSPFMIGID